MTLQGDSTVRSESTTTGHLSALETIREDQALGAAWRRAEAALPKGWNGPSVWQRGPDQWRAYAVERSILRPMPVTVDGPTPTAALEALADKLEALR